MPVWTFKLDEDTGVGKAALDQLSLIAGGVEGIRIEEDAGNLLVINNGGIYGVMSVQTGVTGEATVDGTPRKIAAFNTNGVSNGVTVDNTSDDITCTTTGTYLINASVSFSGSNSATYDIELYKNAAATGFAFQRKLGTGGDVGNSTITGIVNCAADTDTFSLYQSSDGSAMTVTEAQLTVHRISQ